MLLIKNGKIQAENFTFSLPEDMYFYYDTATWARDRLQFVNKSETLELTVQVFKYTDNYSLDRFLNHESFIAMTGVLKVSRGKLSGKSIIYRGKAWDFECYEEQLDIGNGYIALIRVCKEKITPETRESIHTALKSHPIKEFFDNIEAK